MVDIIILNIFQKIYILNIYFEFFIIANLVIFGVFFGIVCMQKNLIVIFMCIELFLVAIAFNFLLFSMFFL